MRIYRGLHNTALLLYSYHKVKARSGTKAAACSNRYATDKRGARCAQILIYHMNRIKYNAPKPFEMLRGKTSISVPTFKQVVFSLHIFNYIRQLHSKANARRCGVFHPHTTVAQLNYPLHQRKSQTVSVR